MSSPVCCPFLCTTGLLAVSIGAQIAPGNAVVATRLPGAPATALLAVDLVTGAAAALPRFPTDGLPPLAIEFDRFDGELLLAVDLGTASRLLRLSVQNGAIAERLLGDVPGHVTELAPSGDVILAAADGAQGGIYQVSRHGGPVTLRLSLPWLSVLQTEWHGSSLATVVWSGSPGPPATDPGSGLVDMTTGSFFMGPTSFVGYPHPVLTGAITLPYPQPRLVLSHADGTIAWQQMTIGGGQQPVVMPIQPQPPAGGANAMKPAAPLNGRPLVLGGSAFPQLWTFDPMAAQPVLATVAGPLPGDPIDFAIAPLANAQLVPFGAACGALPMTMQTNGSPVLGGTFQLELVGGTPNALALFVLGLSDQGGGALPFALPGGCLLYVYPDATLARTTDGSGHAVQALGVPSAAGFVGMYLFAQWLQVPGAQFAASGAMAIRIGT